MKVRDISLMATGAIISIAAIALAYTLLHPTKAQAQAAAAAPGAVAVTVTSNPQSITSTTTNQTSGTALLTQGGLITVHDSANRKVTVVAYQASCYSIGSGPTFAPVINLSTNSSFTY